MFYRVRANVEFLSRVSYLGYSRRIAGVKETDAQATQIVQATEIHDHVMT